MSEKVPLNNVGNSCYINSALQVFLHTPALYENLVECFGKTNLLLTLRKGYCKSSKIQIYDQCDSVMFMNWVLNTMIESGVSSDAWRQSWGGHYTCTECKVKTPIISHNDNMWVIYPPSLLMPSKSIKDEEDREYEYDMGPCLLKQLIEIVDKNCERCGRSTKTKKSMSLETFPPNLFLNLQHFKKSRMLVYEEISIVSQGKTQAYSLKGFIIHTGTLNNGHYVIYIKARDGWHLYDDTTIVKVFDIYAILGNAESNQSSPLLWYEK